MVLELSFSREVLATGTASIVLFACRTCLGSGSCFFLELELLQIYWLKSDNSSFGVIPMEVRGKVDFELS